MKAILPNGTELSYSDYESGMYDIKESSPFPDFEEQFGLKKEEDVFHSDEESASDILLRIATEFQKLAQKLK